MKYPVHNMKNDLRAKIKQQWLLNLELVLKGICGS